MSPKQYNFHMEAGRRMKIHMFISTSSYLNEFVQILCNGQGHSSLIGTVGANSNSHVYVYDSLYTSINQCIKNQIATLLATIEKEITVHLRDVQIQSGGYDCFLFFVAFATSLAFGFEPETIMFDQSLIRAHLKSCLEAGVMKMFLIIKNRLPVPRKAKSKDTIRVYCNCRMPEHQDCEMVQCNLCEEWYRVPFCSTVPEKAMASVDEVCEACH